MKPAREKIRVWVLAASGSFLILMFGAVLWTPVLRNSWLVISDHPEYFIPSESSIFTFHVSEMNSGSGGWWVCAEDRRYFYVHSETREFRYFAFPKSKTGMCAGFQPNDSTTWCAEFTAAHRA